MSRKFRVILGGIMVLILTTLILDGRSMSIHPSRNAQSYPQLLLNSGLTEANEAEVQIILWFEDGMQLSEASEINDLELPQAGWEWRSVGKETGDSKQALSISGYRRVNEAQETQVLEWFEPFAQKVRHRGGIAYLDERVQDGVDVGAYLSQNGFEPKQWAISGTTASIAGWQSGFFPAVQAGRDSVNIQLLTRSTAQGGKTVLAIPALLEEF